MEKLHVLNSGSKQVDEIMVGDTKYIRADKVGAEVISESVGIDYEKLGVAIGIGIAQALNNGKPLIGNNSNDLRKTSNTSTVPKGLSKLPDEKKGSELSAILYGKLPIHLRHPARFRTFYTDFERDTGIGLYEFHKNRMQELPKNKDRSQYPYRKADSIFMIADEDEVFNYVNDYVFTFGK